MRFVLMFCFMVSACGSDDHTHPPETPVVASVIIINESPKRLEVETKPIKRDKD